MKNVIFVAVYLTVVVAALPLDIIEDQKGQEYLLVPVSRERRDLTWGANQNGYSLGQKGTIWSNGDHQVDGAYGASKGWQSHGLKPDTFEGSVDYTHNPSSSTAFVGANRTPGYGTDVNAGLKYNIVQNKDWNVDVTGQVDKHYGGPGGNGKPEGSVFLNVEGKL